MAIHVNIAEANAQFAALIEAAERGEEVILARDGEPVARIAPVERKSSRQPGILKRKYGILSDTPYEAFEPDPDHVAWVDQPLGGVDVDNGEP